MNRDDRTGRDVSHNTRRRTVLPTSPTPGSDVKAFPTITERHSVLKHSGKHIRTFETSHAQNKGHGGKEVHPKRQLEPTRQHKPQYSTVQIGHTSHQLPLYMNTFALPPCSCFASRNKRRPLFRLSVAHLPQCHCTSVGILAYRSAVNQSGAGGQHTCTPP